LKHPVLKVEAVFSSHWEFSLSRHQLSAQDASRALWDGGTATV